MPWLLPAAPATNTVCVKLYIPDTLEDRRNFQGVLYQLGQWYNYERTGDDLGARVAKTWIDAPSTITYGECEAMMFRQNPDNCLILETSIDGGNTWTQIADLSQCFTDSLETTIENNETIQQLIEQQCNCSLPTGTSDIVPGVGNANVPAAGGNCDPDIVWGQVSKLVDFIHEVNVDFFENLRLLDTASDRIEAWLDVLPIAGDFVEAVVNTVTETGDALYDSYTASWNDSLRDLIACELFCLAQEKDECKLTIYDVLDWLLERYNLAAPQNGQLTTLQVAAAFAKYGTIVAQGGGLAYSGDDMVYITWIVQLGAVAVGDSYYNINSAGTYWAEMFDSVPGSGWQLECDPCASQTWTVSWKFTEGEIVDGGMSLEQFGTAPPIESYDGVDHSLREWCYPLGEWVVQRIKLDHAFTATRITIEGMFYAPRTRTGPEFWCDIYDGENLLQHTENAGPGLAGFICDWVPSVAAPVTDITFRSQSASNSCNGEIRTWTVTVSGIGANPFTHINLE